MSTVTITPKGDWPAQIERSLRGAMAYGMSITGRDGENACKQAMILMAQSARHLAKQSARNRPVERDMRLHGAQYVQIYQQGGQPPSRLYKFAFGLPNSKLTGTFEDARRIGNRGLAKRSWMWGLKAFNRDSSGRRAIPGVARMLTILGEKACGYILQNKLSYVEKAMPAGWKNMAESAVANKIMAQAAQKIESKWWAGAGSAQYFAGHPRLTDFFLRAA